MLGKMLERHHCGLTSSYALNQAFISVKKTKVSAAGKTFPKSPVLLFSALLSTLFHPKPHSGFSLSGKLRFISLVEILDCQSDQLSVSRALHGSSNYIPVQLAWAHVAVGQPL